MAQAEQLARIREAWKAKVAAQPGLTCEHPRLTKEYYRGSDSGDLGCVTCGKTMSADDWKKLGKTRTD